MYRGLLIGLLALAGCAHGSDLVLDEGERCPTVAPGHAYRGRIATKDAHWGFLESPRFCFDGQQGQRVTFRLHSDPDEDPRRQALLSFVGADMNQRSPELTVADTPEASTASGILPFSGRYELQFSTATPHRDSSDFRLEFLPSTARMGELRADEPLAGVLDEGDTPDQDGELTDVYHFKATNGLRAYDYVVESTAFEPTVWVLIRRPDAPPQNEFGGGRFRSLENGDVYLLVRGSEAGAKGAYTIEVQDVRARRERGQ